MTMVFAEADAAAAQLASGSWSSGLGQAPATVNDCGGGLTGLAADVMSFVAPLENLLEQVTGDPTGLYQASHTWETYAGDVQTASSGVERALQAIQGHFQGVTGAVAEGTLFVLQYATHAIADWSKVVSQVLQLCVRAVEIMRSLVCAGFELLSSVSGGVTEILFGSWPWEVEKKAEVIENFANNCQQVIEEATSNVSRILQALREMVRLVTDLYRAILPFHQLIEDKLGELLAKYPPGELLGPLGNIPGLLPPGVGDTYNPGPNPYPGSDHRFEQHHDLGYSHEFDLGVTDMTTEQLNQMLREEFGHVFLPSREGDNTQLNTELEGVGQRIQTSLFGMGIPEVTAGEIVVQQVTGDGFVIAAAPGHPEYPGEVAFRLRNVDGHGVLEVTGGYDQTILDRLGFGGNTNPAYSAMADHVIWSDMENRLRDMMNYGR